MVLSKYATRELASAKAPSIDGITLSGEAFRPGPIVLITGGFDWRAQAELGIWRKLLTEVAPQFTCWTVYLGGNPNDRLVVNLQALTPQSLWPVTVVSRNTGPWRDLVQPDRPERSFGTLIKGGNAFPLMVGLPTEEALDRFVAML